MLAKQFWAEMTWPDFQSSDMAEVIAVLFVDLDRFKVVNDRHGHDVGDLLLKSVAARLQVCVRSGDTICRMGGDEFAVILEGADSTSSARRVAGRILEACAQPFVIADHTLRISASVGVAVYPENGHDAMRLLKSADVAMYRAKKAGGNRACGNEGALRIGEMAA